VNSQHSDDGDGVVLRNVGFYNSSDAAICPRRYYPVPLPQKFQDICRGTQKFPELLKKII